MDRVHSIESSLSEKKAVTQRHTLSFLFLIGAIFSVENCYSEDDLPIVPKGFTVDVVAREPMVSNPCVMAFDRLGRICVAQGQQWRGPTPDTPGDRVDILFDENGDGVADRVKTFAEGLNSIQGIAWHGNDLWIANAPDLTVVRDTDGDDEADVYFRVYTGLGNLEHSLHGLNFGPDGKLYMSKGNSKGYNRLDQLAPKTFRDLWGLPSPKGAPDYTAIEKFSKDSYRKKYHTPQDDWGQQGGILRCDPYKDGKLFAQNLEIVSRGFRNPWDITFDDEFNWLGTDNDQTQGDKIFAPFYGSHFGWGHPWSYHWTGKGHLPTVPASAPLFEGSGAGVIYYRAKQFPAEFQNLFFVNDWMRREIYAFRPNWNGALMKCKGGSLPVFARAEGGRTLPSSGGRVFEPTDIEVGPDGALYVLSWGHGYGATIRNGKQVDAGRIYRIRYKGNPLTQFNSSHRKLPLGKWSHEQLLDDLGSDIPAWRINAQNEFLNRGQAAKEFLLSTLSESKLDKAIQTWAVWTLGKISTDAKTKTYLADQIRSMAAPKNIRVQAMRILAYQARSHKRQEDITDVVQGLLTDSDPRLRHEAVQAIWQSRQTQWIDRLLHLAQKEKDRVVFYSTWNAMRDLGSIGERKSWLQDKRAGVRLAALLGLFHDDLISGKEAIPFRNDPDQRIAQLTNDWLTKTGKAQPLVQFTPPSGEFSGAVNVNLKSSVPGSFLTYTLDGSLPTFTSPRVGGPIRVEQTSTLRVAVNQGNSGSSQQTFAKYTINQVEPYRHREFVTDIRTPSGRRYEMDWIGLDVGKRHYTDRDYYITQIPGEIANLPFLRPANNDDRSSGDSWLSMTTTEECDLLVGVDVRNNAPLAWMKIGQPNGFENTGLVLSTTDPNFRLYRKHFPAGKIVLGGNTNNPKTDSGRGHYIVIFDREIIKPEGGESPVTVDQVVNKLAASNPERGRELFLHPKGAGCFKCHKMEGIGSVLAPDLSDVGSRVKSPRVLIESILEPSKVITEGFAQQKVLTFDGRMFAGAVVEETGQAIKLVTQNAEVKLIKKSEIEKRAGSKLSPMPDGFGKMMSAQQVADMVAWLMNQKVVGSPDGFSFKDQKDKTDIFLGKQKIATYLKQHPKLTRRALVNVKTPGGIQVTRNFPPKKPEDLDPGYKGEDGIIHPVMHPGIWVGFGDVHGEDYWRLQSRVVFDRFTTPPKGDRNSGSFAVRNRFMSKDGSKVICTEITHYKFERNPSGFVLTIDAEYKSDESDFYFGDQEESGLAIRVSSPIRVQGGNGTILNSRGEKNGAQVWGKQADWFDYYGTIGDRQVGIMVAANPNNARKSWLHARDYGVVATNPFPKQPRERREPYVKTWIRKGQTFKISYALLIHDLPASTPLDHEKAAKQLIESFK